MIKKYAMFQINSDVHQSLKEFCKDKGYKINGLVESLIREKIKCLTKLFWPILRCKLSWIW